MVSLHEYPIPHLLRFAMRVVRFLQTRADARYACDEKDTVNGIKTLLGLRGTPVVRLSMIGVIADGFDTQQDLTS